MLTLILILIVAVVVWFWYTDRRNTQTALKTSIGTAAKTTVRVVKAVKTEADIVKTHNDIANVETDRLDKFADRNAERIATEFMEDIGLGREFKASQASRLEEAQTRLAEAKAKAKK